MFLGNLVRSGTLALLDAVRSGHRPERPESATILDDKTWAFIERCWAQDPSERPSAADAAEFFARSGGPA